MALVIFGIILKMAVNIKEFYRSSGNGSKKIKTLYLFTWCFPASCVIIFVICCDLSDFFYSRASNSRSGNLNSHTNPLLSRTFWPLCNTIPLELMINRSFRLVNFVFPIQTTWCSPRNLPFVFLLIMHSYARGCTCIRRHLEETVLWGTITWSEMGKQNIQAKKVYLMIQLSTELELLEIKGVGSNFSTSIFL